MKDRGSSDTAPGDTAPGDTAPGDTAPGDSVANDRIRALVVDDEHLARMNLRSLLARQQGWTLVAEATTGPEATEAIRQWRPDVVFLDIRMPGLSGLAVARQLAGLGRRPLVVFATAFEEHALEAFEVEAADYLIKPFSLERFLETVCRLERRLGRAPEALDRASGRHASGHRARERGASSSSGRVLSVKSVGRVRLVPVDDVHWIGAAGNYVRLYVANACYLHRATLASMERDLGGDDFVRVHRSTLVHRAQVAELRTSAAGRYQVVLRDGTELEIAQRFKTRVFATLLGEG